MVQRLPRSGFFLPISFSHKGKEDSIPRLERARRAAAGLLLDLGWIERASQLREAFGYRSGGAVGWHAGHGFGREDFAGPPSVDRLPGALEGQLAGARGDVDIADAADDLVGGD